MPVGPTGDVYRVLQLHPTRRCNLACLHCYSSSGPDGRDQLPLTLVQQVLADAGAEGYTLAGFSGGEPTIYPWLAEALASARAAGMRTTVTSNGMLLSERVLDRLAPHLDLLAISLDGTPASHNRIRGADNAFDVMCRRLPLVQRSGMPFGFIFTLTQHNLHELAWVADFAATQGGQLLQIHPLESTGRAAQALSGCEPDARESTIAFLEVARLQEKYGDALQLRVDLLHRGFVASSPECVMAAPIADARAQALAAIVSPLIVEPDGTVVPVHFGLDRRFALGNLYDAPLAQLSAAWRATKVEAFLGLCRRVYDELIQPAELPFVNWYTLLARQTEREHAATLS